MASANQLYMERESDRSSEIKAQDVEQFLVLDASPNQRQQDKLLVVLRSGNYELLNSSQIELAPDVRAQLLSEIASEDLDDVDAVRVISKIATKINGSQDRAGAEAVFQEIDHNRQIMGIVAELVKNDFEARTNIQPHDLVLLLEKYPTPQQLVDAVMPLLQDIEFGNGSEKLNEYQQSLATLLQKIYGKRYEYYQQYLLMKAQSKSLSSSEPIIEQSITPKEFSITEINATEVAMLMNQVEIHGDVFNGKKLTKEILVAEGLSPRYRVQIGDSIVWFSSTPYNLNGNRIAVVAYVQSGDKAVARSYYRSNSAGVWRYLPQYEAIGGNIHWFSKGHGEDSLSLPFELQRALAEISQSDSPVLEVSDPDFILAGTARNIAENTTYEAEVSVVPIKLPGNFYTGDPLKKIDPESLKFENEQASPDFQNLVSSWKQYSDLYGEVTVEIFASRDKQFHYMFCQDGRGRVWVAAVESSGPIVSTGLKEHWVDAGSLTTPAYEYYSQDDNYGNNKLTSGRYVDMYAKYLSRTPVVQEYLRHHRPELLIDELKIAQEIAGASSFGELFAVLEQVDPAVMSLTGKDAIQLQQLIQSVRQGAIKSNFVTRQLGLRQKVVDLMMRE